MLKQRVITALILLPVVLALVFAAPTWLLAGVFGLIMLIAADELVQLAGWHNPVVRSVFLLVTLAALTGGWVLGHRESGLELLLYAALAWLAVIFIVLVMKPRLPRWLVISGGLLMLVTCWTSVAVLHETSSAGRAWLMLLLLLVWAVDVGGYFTGKHFGKHRLAPAISPGKTWEGVLGGLVVAMLVAVSWSWGLSLDVLPILAIGGGVTVIAIAGDLFESLLKRQAGIKDSGSILPGHGGILDRLDSLIVTAPVYVFVLLTLGLI
ncbi:MAG: phosphatidate cytidylyltransferase [Gammaproteobacteria bacterium]